MPDFVALILAAGVGSRAGGDTPKQYRELLGQTVLAHSVAAFKPLLTTDSIHVVVSEADAFIDALAHPNVHRVGGATRAESVRNGLAELAKHYPPETWVLVHDAARCCLDVGSLTHLTDSVKHLQTAAILAIPVADTLKQVNDQHIDKTVNREQLWQAQTPQCAQLTQLQAALAGDLSGITDEASALEAAGIPVRVVMGDSRNLKLTYPADFAIAAVLLNTKDNT
jgi:2-C-methyl-D-erythritol 4-phosphate cytidylyltransferase